MKTIRQLADELGVSKDKVKYQVRKLPENHIVKVDKIIHLTDDGVQKIKELLPYREVDKTWGNPNGKNKEFYPPEENELYKILKLELQSKNELITSLQEELKAERIHSRKQADKISDLASQLAGLNHNEPILLVSQQTKNNYPIIVDAAVEDEEEEEEYVSHDEHEGFLKMIFSMRR